MLNTFISGRRKRRAKPRLVCADAPGSQLFFGRSHVISAEDQVFSRLNANLTAALRALPDSQRVVVHFVDLEGLGYREIYVLTGIPIGRAKSSLARCRLTSSPSTPNPPVTLDRTSLMGRGSGRRLGIWLVSRGSPVGLRSFDPLRIADLEYRMWVGYYLRRWTHVLAAALSLLRLGFGTNLVRILQAAWLMLRAIQLWAPFPENDPDGAQTCMRELYALVRLRFGEPADPARAAALEIDWWKAHRERQYSADPAGKSDELLESVIGLYSYLFGETEAAVRPAAMHRVQAMDLSDQWVREGCPPDSLLLSHERAALVRAYTALLAAIHHEER